MGFFLEYSLTSSTSYYGDFLLYILNYNYLVLKFELQLNNLKGKKSDRNFLGTHFLIILNCFLQYSHFSESRHMSEEYLKGSSQNLNEQVSKQDKNIHLKLPSGKSSAINYAHQTNLHDFHQIPKFHPHPSTEMMHLDPSVMIFFTIKDLKVGNKLQVYFPKKNPSTSPHFLSKDVADSIPFTSKDLPNLINFFSFSQDSPQTKAMEETLSHCERKPIKGETKSCATSLESLLDFTHSIFGMDSNFSLLTTTHLTNLSAHLQNYTILKVPQEIGASKMVACHTMPYPYAIFYCHSQLSENKVFKVSLCGDNGDRVEAVAVCHMDTSRWSQNHVSFHVLKIEPGTIPVCHFFPADNLVWVPRPSAE